MPGFHELMRLISCRFSSTGTMSSARNGANAKKRLMRDRLGVAGTPLSGSLSIVAKNCLAHFMAKAMVSELSPVPSCQANSATKANISCATDASRTPISSSPSSPAELSATDCMASTTWASLVRARPRDESQAPRKSCAALFEEAPSVAGFASRKRSTPSGVRRKSATAPMTASMECSEGTERIRWSFCDSRTRYCTLTQPARSSHSGRKRSRRTIRCLPTAELSRISRASPTSGSPRSNPCT
mmetsp:Transcript_37926/g.109404  ORF Transcript_37926/g.109404 Transcript_37926/m.109404 type:complete len:243 (+) Transcript_37926:1002-1730(+)